MRKIHLLFLSIIWASAAFAQPGATDSVQTYKKRVLENIEIDLLGSYYSQTGENAATSGGIGSEELQDLAPSIIISIPINDDDVLTLDGNISAYTSASSSNINPFDGRGLADPFVQSSGASKSDTWVNGTISYSHSSDDRNKIWSTKLSFSDEYDYTSIGFGGSYTRLFNEKNTELSANANVFLDSWKLIYPVELRTTDGGNDDDDDDDDENFILQNHTITGNTNYSPKFTPHDNKSRNSYSLGFGLSQILSKRMQASILLDVAYQDGLLSTPFHRIYFKDVEDSFIENYQLADDIERELAGCQNFRGCLKAIKVLKNSFPDVGLQSIRRVKKFYFLLWESEKGNCTIRFFLPSTTDLMKVDHPAGNPNPFRRLSYKVLQSCIPLHTKRQQYFPCWFL